MVTSLEWSLYLRAAGYDDRWPEFSVSIDDRLLDQGQIESDRILSFSTDLEPGPHTISVAFTNKTQDDTVVRDGEIIADKALIVDGIALEGYRLDGFLYQATYYPIGKDPIKSGYMGWNGRWKLDITTPIFTWIHEQQNLGWIYGKNIKRPRSV